MEDLFLESLMWRSHLPTYFLLFQLKNMQRSSASSAGPQQIQQPTPTYIYINIYICINLLTTVTIDKPRYSTITNYNYQQTVHAKFETLKFEIGSF